MRTSGIMLAIDSVTPAQAYPVSLPLVLVALVVTVLASFTVLAGARLAVRRRDQR